MLAAPEPARLAALHPDLRRTVVDWLAITTPLPPERQSVVDTLAAAIADDGPGSRLVFVCTHNSRRSHVTMLWAAVGAYLFGFDSVRTYSGGTEVTAFNLRAIEALRRVGFTCELAAGANPAVRVGFGDSLSTLPQNPPPAVSLDITAAPAALQVTCFSKRYDHPANPQTDFTAVMTCAEADADCPYLPGARRIALRYDDPGRADGSAHEAAAYDTLVMTAGRELLYAFAQARGGRS